DLLHISHAAVLAASDRHSAPFPFCGGRDGKGLLDSAKLIPPDRASRDRPPPKGVEVTGASCEPHAIALTREGGIIGGGLFVVPGIVSIMAMSYVYAAYGNVPVVYALFFGLKAAVLAIVLEATFRIGRRSLKSRLMIAIAAAAFVGIFFFGIPFPIIVLSAALIGFAAASIL